MTLSLPELGFEIRPIFCVCHRGNVLPEINTPPVEGGLPHPKGDNPFRQSGLWRGGFSAYYQ